MHLILDKLILPEWWVALVVAALFALLSRGCRLLTTSGAIAAFVVGFITFGLGGGKFIVPLLTFFITSSLLSRLGRRRKAAADARTSLGGDRDYIQVAANGGIACVIVVLFRIVGHHWPIEQTRYLLMLYLAAFATVNADTWATEIGGLSTAAPRLLSSWKPAAAGSSGAVSALGMCAALAGSFVITGAGWLVWRLSVPEFVTVCWAGFVGSFLDSVLGAGVQALYRHPVTGEFTERTVIDGVKTVRVRGFTWLNNDVVNLLASVGGVACAWVLLRYCAYPYR